MACLFNNALSIICCLSVVFAKISASTSTNSSSARTSYTYYVDSYIPSTWYTNRSLIMNGWKMKVILSTKGFYCGLYCSGSCSSYLFSVVAVGGGGHSPVWSADTARSLGETSSVQLSSELGLVLRDSDGVTVWSSQLNATAKPVVAGMNLTEQGNLVLFDRQSVVVWQSFDHPVDALVVGQRLYKGRRLVPSSFETSWRESPFSATLAARGYLSAFFGTSDGRSLIYYQLALDKNSRNGSGLQYAEAGQEEFVVNMGRYSALYPRKYVEYVKLGADGRLRTYWHNVEGSTSGSADVFAKECLNSTNEYLLAEVNGISYSNTGNGSAPILSNVTVNGCKEACLKNCSCTVVFFSYGSDSSNGNCYMPSEIFSSGGNATKQTNSVMFARELDPKYVATSPAPAGRDMPKVLPPTLPSRHRKNLAAIVSASASGGFITVVLILACLVMSRKNRDEDRDENLKQVPGMPLKFSHEVLQIATKNFKDTLGSGGFGSVFKGVLEDGTKIAVKRLDKLSQGMREFLAEVETIGSLHHFNLVRLVGFCAEKSCRLLVYEYLSNGSLDYWIFNRDQAHHLDWNTRKKIILDIAKGLTYLHEDCRQKIIHLDIKPHNILLDKNFNAKVSDFGLSTLIDRDKSQVLTNMRGTPGYLAPEWKELRVTVKVDVYSFGIVLLEIVCRRKNVESSRSESSFHLLQMLQKKAQEDRLVDIVEELDEDMEKNREEVARMIRIGAWCLQDDPEKRPSMSTVVKVLEGVMEVDADISYKFSHAIASVPVVNDHFTLAPQASILSAPR